jgi:hypothetical protein
MASIERFSLTAGLRTSTTYVKNMAWIRNMGLALKKVNQEERNVYRNIDSRGTAISGAQQKEEFEIVRVCLIVCAFDRKDVSSGSVIQIKDVVSHHVPCMDSIPLNGARSVGPGIWYVKDIEVASSYLLRVRGACDSRGLGSAFFFCAAAFTPRDSGESIPGCAIPRYAVRGFDECRA